MLMGPYRPKPRSHRETMRREPLFSAGGVYPFLLRRNLLLHREAIRAGSTFLSAWRRRARPQLRIFRVLDLACGSQPTIVAGILRRFRGVQFRYTGIDVNEDQIRCARETFRFSKNVNAAFRRGDAWSLAGIPEKGRFDLVFIGLNVHHCTPAMIRASVRKVFQRMAPMGILVNHDIFRPEGSKGGWREDLLDAVTERLRQEGAGSDVIHDVIGHMREKDYPISRKEMKKILEKTGFQVSVPPLYPTANPLRKFYSMIVGYKIQTGRT